MNANIEKLGNLTVKTEVVDEDGAARKNTHKGLSESQVNDDGLVSEEEFLRWMASQEEIGGQEDDLMDDLLAAFRVFDKDGNGYITKDELKMAMDLIGEPVTEAQLDDMLKAIDIDHDGRINYEEFVKILL
ncbi:Calcium-binding protein E63-1 like protein [Argiope bruennichi]|uniref:Calcium-binding protein E63-1 like protein n=1 Tax=Argiope bruennichi TaxID=94029 RepID=A0A8T0EK22_ARGBR|nr:Calcium-binding protein E63-1 like protein [Argiope bruennichi]